MTRKECEAKILEKLKEISDVYREYNPDGDFLTMTIYLKTLSYSAFNSHWPATDEDEAGEDVNAPIDFHVVEGEEDEEE